MGKDKLKNCLSLRIRKVGVSLQWVWPQLEMPASSIGMLGLLVQTTPLSILLPASPSGKVADCGSSVSDPTLLLT